LFLFRKTKIYAKMQASQLYNKKKNFFFNLRFLILYNKKFYLYKKYQDNFGIYVARGFTPHGDSRRKSQKKERDIE